MSALSIRRREQQLLEEQKRLEEEQLMEIEQSDQELRNQRGIVRSPGHNVMDDNELMEYNERIENHNQSNFELINKQNLLEHFINNNINKAIEDNKENIDELSQILEDDTITLDVTSKIVFTARNNTHWFMINSTPNYENLPLLTNEIFLFSLFDIGTGYKYPNYTSQPNYIKLLQSMRKDRLDSLITDNFFVGNQRLMDLCFQNMEKLVEKNINDGASIKKEENKKLLRFDVGGKTKRRRYKRKKTIKRRVKSKRRIR